MFFVNTQVKHRAHTGDTFLEYSARRFCSPQQTRSNFFECKEKGDPLEPDRGLESAEVRKINLCVKIHIE